MLVSDSYELLSLCIYNIEFSSLLFVTHWLTDQWYNTY